MKERNEQRLVATSGIHLRKDLYQSEVVLVIFHVYFPLVSQQKNICQTGATSVLSTSYTVVIMNPCEKPEL